MDRNTVFTKTAKGITQVNQRSASLSKDLMKVLKLIDGKSNFGQLLEKADVDKNVLEKALNTLTKDGFARIFETRKEEVDPFASDDDFDFTAPNKLPGSTQRVVAGAANDISELSRQHEKADADRKAKEQAHEQARVKAKAEAEARARAEAEARARQQAEQAAMEQAQRAKEAAERARAELEAKMREEEARKRAVAEQAARVAAEQKAKEEAENRRLAEMRAKAEREANERARAEMEAKLREEEAKQRALLEQQAKAAAELKAKEEAESRRLAELRVKAEREAQALAEARARAEAEAAAMAKARAEAEAAAQRKAQEANAAEAQMKARLKEEIEARIRQEMEALLRNELEEKTRAEMQEQILAEAKLAAKAELEERLREEREAIARAENEARAKAEKDAQARAEAESKKRAEAEARAAAEAEARLKAEEETRALRAKVEQDARRAEEERARLKAQADAEAQRLKATAEEEARRARDAEARARAEAESAARERATVEQRVQAERQAKYEAEARAKIEAEEREKRERELGATIEAERRAKEEAEKRARIEARARETVEADTRVRVQAELEADLEKKAEIEGKAQAKAYMAAKEKAERDEEDRIRAEQERKAREIAEVLRTKVERDEDFTPEEGPARKKYRRKRGILKPALIGLVLLAVLAIGVLHVIPMRTYTDKVERTLSAWFHDDVSIGSMTFRLVPTPHLNIENMTIGKSLDAKASKGKLNVGLGSLFGGGDTLSVSAVELEGVRIGSEAAKRIPAWAVAEGKPQAGGIQQIRLRNVVLDVKPPLDPFDATLQFERDGTLKSAALQSGTRWSGMFKPGEGGYTFDFNARGWQLPIGAPVPIGAVALRGTITGTEIVVPEFEADTMEGKVNGTLRVNYAQGVKLDSDLSLARINVAQLVAVFTKDIAITGRMDGNFQFAAQGPSVEQLFANTRAQGKFKIGEGSISNVDLVAVMQSDSAGSRAGVTKFNELTGELASSDLRSNFRQVNLQGGVLRGNGSFDVGNNSALSGRIALEIRSQVAQDRGSFAVSGTVSRPIIRRGG